MAGTAAPPRPAAQRERAPGYDEDLVLWSERQAALIRAGRLDLVDWQNVAEEIESLGASERRAVGHRIEILMMHLLKWQFQPVHRSRSWRATIRTQRGRIERLLKQSPSLRREVPEISADHYGLGARDGVGRDRLRARDFPGVAALHAGADPAGRLLPRPDRRRDAMTQHSNLRTGGQILVDQLQDPRHRARLRRARRELSRAARRAPRQRDPLHHLPPGRRRGDDGRGLRQAHRARPASRW